MIAYVASHPMTSAVLLLSLALVLGTLRNHLVEALAAFLDLVASPSVALVRAIRRFKPHLQGWIDRTLGALSASHEGGAREAIWAGWDVIIPLIWLSLFAGLVCTDLFLVDLRLAAMIGVTPYWTSGPFPVDVFLSVMFVAITAVFAFALPELRRSSMARRPWVTLGDEDRQLLIKLCLICLGLTIGAAAVLWFWGGLQVNEGGGASSELSSGLPLLFWLLLVLPLIVATGIAGWAALSSPAALLALILMAAWASVHVVEAACIAFIWILDKLAEMLTRLLDIIARPGVGILNIIGQRLPEDWRFEIVFVVRPRIGADLEERGHAGTAQPSAPERLNEPVAAEPAPTPSNGTGGSEQGPHTEAPIEGPAAESEAPTADVEQAAVPGDGAEAAVPAGPTEAQNGQRAADANWLRH